jgi:hypothetical protein
MRTALIAAILGCSALSACSLYFDSGTSTKQHALPDAHKGDNGDGGSWPSDAGIDDGGCWCNQPDAATGGCGDAGSDGGYIPDANNPWPPDAAVYPDAP